MGLTKPRAYQIYDIDYKQSVRAITLTNITLSGGAPSQVDNVSLSLNDRVLVAGQSSTAQNGLYYVTTVGSGSNGTWERSTDGNQTGEIESGMIVMVTEGTIWADTSWKLVTNDPITIGVTGLVFEQNTGDAFGNVNANGTSVTANTASGTLNLAAGDNISITGNNTSKTVTIGVTGISLNSISNGTSNVNVVSSGGNVTVGVGGTGNVAVFGSTGANITGTLGVSGNITGGNITTAGQVAATGNIDTAGTININSSSGMYNVLNITGAALVGYGSSQTWKFFTQNSVGGGPGSWILFPDSSLQTTAYPGTTSTLSLSGNITGGNLISNVAVVATGNITGGNLITAGLIDATGNITGGNINSNALVNGTTITATGNLVGGNANITNAVNAATISTSGNATIGGNLIVQGNITYINIEDLQIEDPVIILGTGPNGAPLTVNDNKDRGIFMEYYTTGIGNAFIGWDNSTGNMIVASDAGLTNDVVSVETYGTLQAGNLYVQSILSTGNVTGGNLTTAGLISATGNITGGNLSGTSISGTLTTAAQTNITSVGTLTSLGVTGNITSGNVSGTRGAFTNVTGTLETASQPNITSVGTLGSLTVTANVAGGNLTTAGQVVATGNITGGNLVTAGQISATGTITTAGGTNSTGFAVGNSAVSNVGLGFFPTAGTRGDYAIRDYSNVASTMYFDVGMGGSAAGDFQFRTSNAFTLVMKADSTGITTPGRVYALELNSTQSSGDEGGQLNLAKAATNTTLAGNVIVDIYQNKFRIFEDGGTNRGAYIDLTATAASVGTNLLAGSGGGNVAGSNTQVQFNDGGAFGANASFTYDKVLNTLTAGTIAGTLNGVGQNFKVGDDAWIGDINVADTIGLKGQQNAANAYIVFGNSDATGKLGRSGTGPLTYAGAFTATGNISGGNLSGTSITGTLTTAAQTNITSVGTLSSLTVTANVAGGNLTTAGQVVATGNVNGGNIVGTLNGSGANVTSISATNISSGTLAQARLANSAVTLGSTALTLGATVTTVAGLSSVTSTTFVGALTGAATTAGTVTTAAQPNITSVGTLSSLTVTANVAGGNLTTAGQVVATGNITGGNLKTSGVTISSTGVSATTVTATANVAGGNLTTAGQVVAVGNISGNFFIGNGSQLTGITSTPNAIVNGTSNVSISSSGGNVTVGVAGSSNVVVFSAGVLAVNGLITTPKTISVSGTLPANTNSQLISPVTINTGVTITVPDSSTLYITP